MPVHVHAFIHQQFMKFANFCHELFNTSAFTFPQGCETHSTNSFQLEKKFIYNKNSTV